MLGDRVVAEEVTQDVFVRVWEKLPGFRGEAAFSTWLHRVAVNVVLSRRKVTGLHQSRTTDDEEAQALVASKPTQVGDLLDLESAIVGLPTGAAARPASPSPPLAAMSPSSAARGDAPGDAVRDVFAFTSSRSHFSPDPGSTHVTFFYALPFPVRDRRRARARAGAHGLDPRAESQS